MAAALLGQLWGQFLFLLLELLEFHLDQLMTIQFKAQGGEELRTQPFLANLQRGLESLCPGLESTDLSVGEGDHGAKILDVAGENTRNGAWTSSLATEPYHLKYWGEDLLGIAS
jgi:hypothetical protein